MLAEPHPVTHLYFKVSQKKKLVQTSSLKSWQNSQLVPVVQQTAFISAQMFSVNCVGMWTSQQANKTSEKQCWDMKKTHREKCIHIKHYISACLSQTQQHWTHLRCHKAISTQPSVSQPSCCKQCDLHTDSVLYCLIDLSIYRSFNQNNLQLDNSFVKSCSCLWLLHQLSSFSQETFLLVIAAKAQV